jgi:hypothetical protein
VLKYKEDVDKVDEDLLETMLTSLRT